MKTLILLLICTLAFCNVNFEETVSNTTTLSTTNETAPVALPEEQTPVPATPSDESETSDDSEASSSDESSDSEESSSESDSEESSDAAENHRGHHFGRFPGHGRPHHWRRPHHGRPHWRHDGDHSNAEESFEGPTEDSEDGHRGGRPHHWGRPHWRHHPRRADFEDSEKTAGDESTEFLDSSEFRPHHPRGPWRHPRDFPHPPANGEEFFEAPTENSEDGHRGGRPHHWGRRHWRHHPRRAEGSDDTERSADDSNGKFFEAPEGADQRRPHPHWHRRPHHHHRRHQRGEEANTQQPAQVEAVSN